MKYITFLLLTVLFSIFSIDSFSQSSGHYTRQSVFVEVLGNGLLATLNYDTRLNKNRQDGLGLRIGVGGLSVSGTSDAGVSVSAGVVTIPLELNYLMGKKRSAFEIGAGLTPLILSAKLKTDNDRISGTGSSVNGVISFGYRYQPLNKGFLFKLDWSPIFNSIGFSPAWFGISFGYSFK